MIENDSNKTLENNANCGLIPAYREMFVHFCLGSTGNEPHLLYFLNAVLESDGLGYSSGRPSDWPLTEIERLN